jgi:hypothetical protein
MCRFLSIRFYQRLAAHTGMRSKAITSNSTGK